PGKASTKIDEADDRGSQHGLPVDRDAGAGGAIIDVTCSNKTQTKPLGSIESSRRLKLERPAIRDRPGYVRGYRLDTKMPESSVLYPPLHTEIGMRVLFLVLG